MSNSSSEPTRTLAIVTAILGAAFGAGITAVTFYFGPYAQNMMTARVAFASDIASYYSAAAAEYYASNALDLAEQSKTNHDSAYFLQLQKEEDEHYQVFLTASTKLAAEVPPAMRERVLDIEDIFEKIPKRPRPSDERAYFDRLDAIRSDILASTNFQRGLNPIWK